MPSGQFSQKSHRLEFQMGTLLELFLHNRLDNELLLGKLFILTFKTVILEQIESFLHTLMNFWKGLHCSKNLPYLHGSYYNSAADFYSDHQNISKYYSNPCQVRSTVHSNPIKVQCTRFTYFAYSFPYLKQRELEKVKRRRIVSTTFFEMII